MHVRGVNIMLNGLGSLVMVEFIGSSVTTSPSGKQRSYFCKKVTRKRKSSILARLSPRHARLPTVKKFTKKKTQSMYRMIIDNAVTKLFNKKIFFCILLLKNQLRYLEQCFIFSINDDCVWVFTTVKLSK